jgi:Protein of unknown function (DUF2752)
MTVLGASLRTRPIAVAPPWGLLLCGVGALGCAAVGLLHLDHLPFSVCMFKALTGLPCPTCGTTRAFARLFALDPTGALAMNPLAVVLAAFVALWGLAELALVPSGRSVDFEASPRLARALRIAAVTAAVVNWAYLIAAGR